MFQSEVNRISSNTPAVSLLSLYPTLPSWRLLLLTPSSLSKPSSTPPFTSKIGFYFALLFSVVCVQIDTRVSYSAESSCCACSNSLLDLIDTFSFTLHVDHYLDNLYPNPSLWGGFQDLHSTGPAKENCRYRWCRLYGSHPATWARSFRSYRSYRSYRLSLIHIWRCRRSTLCRSRWSPYH